jgi:hypothetical protein
VTALALPVAYKLTVWGIRLITKSQQAEWQGTTLSLWPGVRGFELRFRPGDPFCVNFKFRALADSEPESEVALELVDH